MFIRVERLCIEIFCYVCFDIDDFINRFIVYEYFCNLKFICCYVYYGGFGMLMSVVVEVFLIFYFCVVDDKVIRVIIVVCMVGWCLGRFCVYDFVSCVIWK